MPTSEAPTDVNEPRDPAATSPATDRAPEPGSIPAGQQPEPALPIVSQSRWVDYNTHELLQMISDLEDERRWARLREGVWIAVLIHLALISALFFLPKYVFITPRVVDRNQALKANKDFTYLDTPFSPKPKVDIKPVPEKAPTIDKKTLEEMNKQAPPAPAPAPAPQEAPKLASPVTPPPIPPNQQSQSQLEAPRPSAVPAHPNFAMNSGNPADQLRDAMRGASRNPGMNGNLPSSGGLAMHPGAGTGGIEVLSDTQGVDFSGWLQRWHRETERTWDPLIPDEVNPPLLKAGAVQIRFKVLPNGRIMDGSMLLEGRSGDVALDRAAWGALTGSNYPPLPRDFHGPYLELRAVFLYNIEPSR